MIISEILENPAAARDADGEWFEPFDGGAAAVGLRGGTVSDDGIDSFVTQDSLVIAAGAKPCSVGSATERPNGSVSTDYVHGSVMSLANGADELIHADPAEGLAGDAKGDGNQNFPDDEFVEIANVGAGSVDLSGMTLCQITTWRAQLPEGTSEVFERDGSKAPELAVNMRVPYAKMGN